MLRPQNVCNCLSLHDLLLTSLRLCSARSRHVAVFFHDDLLLTSIRLGSLAERMPWPIFTHHDLLLNSIPLFLLTVIVFFRHDLLLTMLCPASSRYVIAFFRHDLLLTSIRLGPACRAMYVIAIFHHDLLLTSLRLYFAYSMYVIAFFLRDPAADLPSIFPVLGRMTSIAIFRYDLLTSLQRCPACRCRYVIEFFCYDLLLTSLRTYVMAFFRHDPAADLPSTLPGLQDPVCDRVLHHDLLLISLDFSPLAGAGMRSPSSPHELCANPPRFCAARSRRYAIAFLSHELCTDPPTILRRTQPMVWATSTRRTRYVIAFLRYDPLLTSHPLFPPRSLTYVLRHDLLLSSHPLCSRSLYVMAFLRHDLLLTSLRLAPLAVGMRSCRYAIAFFRDNLLLTSIRLGRTQPVCDRLPPSRLSADLPSTLPHPQLVVCACSSAMTCYSSPFDFASLVADFAQPAAART
ncbi:hypothetical protein MVEN_01988500 [Mycena venus]|uniref:Uncharacterized protein n=1 Tax=Mycena venus TaxID=2733690 RepID=A0A8H7CKX6_9AGAR|nr:hypothetical protein MVEN_01988500 [Mycena venus]